MSPFESARAPELRRTIGEALAGLSPNDRAVIVLREIEGLSYEQIGEVVGRSINNVKVTLHRARARLRDRLGVTVRQS